ncbi:MAG: hypothetical protein JSV11_06670 [Nitrospiraceae bacterium]|nr:MAG: hypothetical protein JSV11_06670 [Nitrospiraceae bacterium]
MSLEIGLLSLETILLIATIILLVYSIKEGKQRDKLILEVGKATRILTRQEYFLNVIDAMMDAKEEIRGCITGSIPSDGDKARTRDIITTIKRRVKEGIRITYLLPKFPDRLHIGYLYARAGAEVLYSSCLMVHNIRFTTIDGAIVVMGIPENTGEKQATKKGYRIPSEGLAMVLNNYFESCEKQINFSDYVKDVMTQTGASVKHLAREYQIDEEGLKKIIEKV